MDFFSICFQNHLLCDNGKNCGCESFQLFCLKFETLKQEISERSRTQSELLAKFISISQADEKFATISELSTSSNACEFIMKIFSSVKIKSYLLFNISITI